MARSPLLPCGLLGLLLAGGLALAAIAAPAAAMTIVRPPLTLPTSTRTLRQSREGCQSNARM
jgi:hypothetical protein